MATAFTSLLGLALPVTGELAGTWGDTVNNSITSLLDSAVAGTTALSTDVDVTLTTTTGATNQSRQAILLCTGTRSVLRTITAPARSKMYVVINSTTGGFGVKIVGVGPTTGVTVANGKTAVVVWNGSDFVEVAPATATTATNLAGGVAGSLPYQTAASTTTFLGIGAANYVLTSTGTAPTWTINTGTGNVVRATSPTITTPTITTSATVPLLIGGTATTSTLTLRSTSGVGTTGADIIFQTGNNGATEAMRVLNSGNVGIGTTAPTALLQVQQTLANTYASTSAITATPDGSLTSIVNLAQATDVFRGINFSSRSAAGDLQNSYFGAVSTATGNSPIFVWGQRTGATAYAERMRITSAGDVGIGTASPTSKLTVDGTFNTTGNVTLGDATTDTVTVNGYMSVGGTPTASQGLRVIPAALTGTTQFGSVLSITATSAATVGVEAARVQAGTAAAAFTTVYAAGLWVRDALLGAGSTINNNYGIYIDEKVAGTNNYGITSLVSSGTNKWNIYASGSAANFFAGNVGMGIVPNAGWAATTGAVLQLRRGAISSYASGPADHIAVSSNAYAATSSDPGLTTWRRNFLGAATLIEGRSGNIYLKTAGTAAADSDIVWMDGLYVQSTGDVGIGTTNPLNAVRLHVEQNANANYSTSFAPGTTPSQLVLRDISDVATYTNPFAAVQFGAGNTGSGWSYIAGARESAGASFLALGTGVSSVATERMRIDSAGNVGLGVTPNAWDAASKALEFNAGAIESRFNNMEYALNAYFNGTNWIYKRSNFASIYVQSITGQQQWFTAPSGTAGAAITITQAMTLTATGNLAIGIATPVSQIANSRVVHIDGGANAAEIRLTNNTTGTAASNGGYFQQTGNDLYLYNAEASFLALGTNNLERMRIDSAGNVGVGITPSAWRAAAGTKALQIGVGGALFSQDSSGTYWTVLASNSFQNTSNVDAYINTGFATSYTQTAGKHIWATAPSGTAGNPITFTQAMTLDASGKVLVGATTARANYNNATFSPRMQIEGVDSTGASLAITCNTTTDADGPALLFGKSATATVGSNTLVANGESLGYITFEGNDGTEFVRAAQIKAEVDGTPGVDDMPGRLVFSTTADGSATTAERMRITSAGNVGIGTTTPVNALQVNGSFGRNAPVTKAASFTLAATENWLICNGTATITVTLPAASSWTGREVMIKTIAAFTVVSASSNVVPLVGGAAGTAILAATAGKFATLVSDGTNWIIMQGN